MVFLFVAGRSIGVIRKPGSLNAIPAGTMALTWIPVSRLRKLRRGYDRYQ